MTESHPISSAPAAPKAKTGASRRTYVMVFVALTVLTLLEVGVTYLPVPQAPVLIPMALAKAALVALFFMHLKYDRGIFSFVFIAGLIMGLGLIVALLALFAPGAHM